MQKADIRSYFTGDTSIKFSPSQKKILDRYKEDWDNLKPQFHISILHAYQDSIIRLAWWDIAAPQTFTEMQEVDNARAIQRIEMDARTYWDGGELPPIYSFRQREVIEKYKPAWQALEETDYELADEEQTESIMSVFRDLEREI